MTQHQPEQDDWGEWPFRLDEAKLSVVRAALEETPVILEHRFYRGSQAPHRLVFDEFEALAEYLRISTRAGDAVWIWRYSDVCRDADAFTWGKISDDAGRVPKGGPY
jgi:hypothetical protein